MESDVGANSRTKNGKNDADEILHETPPHSLDQELDNDSHRNNNESGTVIGSSFIPVRNKSNLPQSRLVQRYRIPDDNRTASSQCSALAIETVSYPHSSPSRNYPRRHSVCVDDLSEVCSCHGHKNCNQDSRFHVVRYRPASPSSLCAVSNNQGAPSEVGDNSLGQGEVRNGNDNIKFEKRSSCNGSEQAFSLEIHASVPPVQRLKDKSFIRKSTLNRIEFVQPAQQALGYISNSGQNYHHEQHSTSEANSDKSPVEDTVPAAVKRKGGFHHPGRGSFESQWKTDFQHGTKTSLSTRAMPLFGSRPHVEQLKARNRRGARVCIASFEKSFSAGEHDVHTDPSDCSRKTKVCFSAQETCHAESKPSYRQVMPSETKACVPSNHVQNVPKRHSSLEDVLTVSANGHRTNSETALHACDNSSQIVAKDDSSGGASVGGKGFVFSNEGNGDGGEGVGEDNAANEMQGNGGLTQQNEQVTIGSCSATQDSPCVKLDQDLFACSSAVPASCSHFPVMSDENTDLKLSECSAVASEEVKSGDLSSSFNACSEEVVDVMNEISCLEISPEPVDPSIAKSSSHPLESEKESTRQISSILRRKSGDEKREIHGILKNTSEDRAQTVKHRPSILKHRESSEEKDSWSQSDLHSILKKSSEDESSSNSPDIRPILKNTSTDDESSGLTSKPKPILKKRTSFNEDCSYACFHSGELKPILKKKTISEMSEEQPKPILKTRRKSEESASIMNEFSVGARPRAYSADRGVRIALEKKLNDDDFT